MRGRTFHDAIVILDEAQNSTEEQIKLAMTRLGLNSKMIITGDPTQSDLKGEIALPKIVESMKKVQGIGIVEFNEIHIVRHPLVADILAAWPK
jgi:phosphate starvation-inducible PhoH-like protein